MSPNEQEKFDRLRIFGDYLQDQGHPLGKFLSEGRFKLLPKSLYRETRHLGRKAKGDEHFAEHRVDRHAQINPDSLVARIISTPKNPDLPPFVIHLKPQEWRETRIKPETKYRSHASYVRAQRSAWDGLARYLRKQGHPIAELMRPENHQRDTTGIEYDDPQMERLPDLEKHGFEFVGKMGDDLHFRIGDQSRHAPGAAAKLKLASSVIMKVPLPEPVANTNRSYILP